MPGGEKAKMTTGPSLERSRGKARSLGRSRTRSRSKSPEVVARGHGSPLLGGYRGGRRLYRGRVATRINDGSISRVSTGR